MYLYLYNSENGEKQKNGGERGDRSGFSEAMVRKALRDYADRQGLKLTDEILSEIVIEKTEKGKPYFKGLPGAAESGTPSVHYSVSHSGNIWGCLMADEPVGFDLEVRREKVNYEEIARRYFTQEEQELILAGGRDAFFDVWVRKEAYVKYLGTGLGEGLDSFSVVENGALSSQINSKDETRQHPSCFVGTCEIGNGVMAAYCCASEDPIRGTVMLTENHESDHRAAIKKESTLKVYGSGVLFSLIVGFSFLGVKTCLSVAAPIVTLAYRFNFAFLASIILVVMGLIKIDLTGRPKRNLALTAGLYLGFMALQALGLVFSTTIESGIIFAMVPILAKIIASLFLKETTSWKQNIFVCMSIASVITMFILGASDITVNLAGLILLMLSSLSMACSNVMMRYVRGIYKPFEISFFITGGGCLLFNLATIIFGIKYGTLGSYFEPLTHMNFVIAAAYLGIPSTLVSAQLMAYMLNHMEAVKGTIFGNLSTAISIVAGVVVLGEPLQIYHIICTILIIMGVIGLSLPSMQKNGKQRKEKNLGGKDLI